MAELIIYGASDDLVEVEGVFEEEFEAYPKWSGWVIAPDGKRLKIKAEFGARGKHKADWTLGIENTGTYPDWTIRFGERPDYEGDPALIIDVPEGTIVKENN